jgi:hypothetical protein
MVWMVESLKAIKYIDGDSFAAPRGQCTVELLARRESAMHRAGDRHGWARSRRGRLAVVGEDGGR